MNDQQVHSSLLLLSNAYLQYLLYTNKVIKSSSLSSAHTSSDMERKLSFFIKTHWIRELKAANLFEHTDNIRISNGSVTITYSYSKWNNWAASIQRLEKGYYSHLSKILDCNNEMLIGKSNLSHTASELSVYLNVHRLLTEAMSERSAYLELDSTEVNSNKSFFKEMFDQAFIDLIKLKNLAKPFTEFKKHIKDDILINCNINADYRFTAFEVCLLLKGCVGHSIYINSFRGGFDTLSSAAETLYLYAMANDKVSDLEEATCAITDILMSMHYVFEYSVNEARIRNTNAFMLELQTYIEFVSSTLRE